MSETYEDIAREIRDLDREVNPPFKYIEKHGIICKELGCDSSIYALDIAQRVRNSVASDGREWYQLDKNGNRVYIGYRVRSEDFLNPYTEFTVDGFAVRLGRLALVNKSHNWCYPEEVLVTNPDNQEQVDADAKMPPMDYAKKYGIETSLTLDSIVEKMVEHLLQRQRRLDGVKDA